MMAANNLNLTITHLYIQPKSSNHLRKPLILNQIIRNLKSNSLYSAKPHTHYHFRICPSLLPRASGDAADSTSQSSTLSDVDVTYSGLSSTDENYVPLLVRMLGLDNDILDREQAVIALWKYSLGGKRYVDKIMQFHGCVNLTVHLLRSKSSNACEAAAGLLRMISSVNSYRDTVAKSGAIEETTALLRRPSLTSEVKEQSICMLCNLTADEKYRVKIANTVLLPVLVKFLNDEDMKIVEVAGGVLANLALSSSNHSIMVEDEVIPKLANFLTNKIEGSKVIRKEAKNALLEFIKDDYYKILVMEEGLIPVPLVGAAAYASFKPALHSWPSLPDGTEFRRSSKGPSRYGASELLLGLNVEDNTDKIDNSKMDAIVGRTQQQFLARIGAIEFEDEHSSAMEVTSFHQTLLPLKDGVARLVLILELEDETAIAKAADAIAGSSVNEHIRISFKEAGAVCRLVDLLSHASDKVKLSVLNALDKLSISNSLCGAMEAEGVTHPLVSILTESERTESILEKTLSILARIWDPNKQMKLKFYDGPVNGSSEVIDSRSQNITPGLGGNTEEVKDVLDSAVTTRLVNILKIASPSLQIKVASILEYLVMIEPFLDSIVAAEISSALLEILKQLAPKDLDSSTDDQELGAAYVEEVGMLVSQACRLLTKLLDHQQFRETINANKYTNVLQRILKSEIPLNYKEWVAACLVRLSFFSSPFENPITTEVTFYETIPRLIEQLETSFSEDDQEAVALELNRIVSEGVADATRAVASHGGIFPLVKLLDGGSERAIEAVLAILYNLTMDTDNHSAILAAGAVPILRRIIVSQKPYWSRALLLLRNLPV